jgi:hypothetical protein
MRYTFLRVFANDRVLDSAELRFIEKLALRDGQVDDDERAVLRRIFARITPDMVRADVRDEIDRFKRQFGI